jgi:hypothetical protein
MKKFIVFLFCFFAGMPVLAKDKPYLRLSIEETKTDKGIDFSLKKAEVFFGDCDHFVRHLDKMWQDPESDYIFETYNSEHELIGEYVATSGRFILWDGEKDGKMTGGEIELKKGKMDVIVPFNKKHPAHFFVIKYDTKKKNNIWKFVSLPVKKMLEQCSDIEKKIAEKEKH